jgi:hypothetical protein
MPMSLPSFALPPSPSGLRRTRPSYGGQVADPHDARYSDVKQPRGCASAFSRQVLPEFCKTSPSKTERAQGKPGAQHTRSLVCSEESTRVSHYGSAETRRPSLRNGLRLMFVLPGVRDLIVTVACKSSFADLTPAQGRQDHTPSPSARCRSSALKKHARHLRVHRIPRPTFRDDWP